MTRGWARLRPWCVLVCTSTDLTRWPQPGLAMQTRFSSSSVTRRDGRAQCCPVRRPRYARPSPGPGSMPTFTRRTSSTSRPRTTGSGSPSRKLLTQQLAAAASIGAKALIVHGGHVTSGVDPAEGYANWRKVMERVERPIPLLIENTAGGTNAMARTLDGIALLWDAGDGRGRGRRRRGGLLPRHLPRRPGLDLTEVADKARPSPAGSIWCTATTHGTSSPRAGTGTPT